MKPEVKKVCNFYNISESKNVPFRANSGLMLYYCIKFSGDAFNLLLICLETLHRFFHPVVKYKTDNTLIPK
jgi:hypothetical protein